MNLLLLPLLLGAFSLASMLPAESQAGSARMTCRRTLCKPGKRQCIDVFRARFDAEKSECMSAGTGYERKQCTRERRLVFKLKRNECRAAYRVCRECCRSEDQSQCTVALCGDERRAEGEVCDGTDDDACPGLCRRDCTCEVCDCCQTTFDLMSFETVTGTGTTGWLRNFRCSHDPSAACVVDADCDFGTCYVTPPLCAGKLSVACAQDSDCQGSCAEVHGASLPLGLRAGHVYIGGGEFAVPIAAAVPPEASAATRVVDCDLDAGGLILGPSAPQDVGERQCTQGRSCSETQVHCEVDGDCPGGETCKDRCFLGPVMPIPAFAASVCVINVIGKDASGTLGCGGETELLTTVRSVVHLTGDLFTPSKPPDVFGLQPCPLCDTLCEGPDDAERFPCDDDQDCLDVGNSSNLTCGTSTKCLGGPNDGNPCTPESPPALLGLPPDTRVSHDCPPDPLQDVTSNIGGVPVDLRLVSHPLERVGVDRPGGSRVFSGFCRDVTGAGSNCFDGDTRPGCPPAIPPADGNAVRCNSDADCQNLCDGGSCIADTDEYESCVQRNPGAFSFGEATQITVDGSAAGECVADGQPHPTRLVTIFDIPPLFDRGDLLDNLGDLPGPGTAILEGEIELQNLP